MLFKPVLSRDLLVALKTKFKVNVLDGCPMDNPPEKFTEVLLKFFPLVKQIVKNSEKNLKKGNGFIVTSDLLLCFLNGLFLDCIISVNLTLFHEPFIVYCTRVHFRNIYILLNERKLHFKYFLMLFNTYCVTWFVS